MRKLRTILLTQTGCAVIALLQAAPTIAQTNGGAGDTGATSIETVVVTAEKRSERAIDVPQSLTILTAGDISRGGVTTNADLTYLVPGLQMNTSGVNAAPSLRGITSLVPGPGLDPNVATYVDGVYVSESFSQIDLPDVDNVSVLKGPQGTLFGRNATGGAILITTLAPSFDWTGKASVGYGRFDDKEFTGYLSGPIIPDILAFSVSAYYEANNGYQHDIVHDRDANPFAGELYRGKLLYTPAENMQFTLAAFYSYHKDAAGVLGAPYGGDTVANLQPGAIVPHEFWDVASNLDGRLATRGFGVSLTGVIETDPGTLTIIGDYDKHVSHIVAPYYYAWVPSGGGFYFPTETDEKHTAELDFASKQYGPFNYIAGLYYYHDVGAYDPLQVLSDIPSFGLSIFGFQSSDSYAAFAEGNYKITDRLTLIAGVRYSDERRSVYGGGAFGLYTSPPFTPINFGSKTFAAWTPRVSLRYAVADNTNVYFTYSEGFKSGGYNNSAVFGSTPPLTPVLPEKLNAYEVGVKTAPTDSVSLNASAFYYDYTNQQVAAFEVVSGVPLQTSNNAAASTIYGAEIEGTAQLTDEFGVHTGVSLLHARYDSYPDAVAEIPIFVPGIPYPVGNNPTDVNAAGRQLVATPEWTISFGGNYIKTFTEGTLTAKADVFSSARLFFDPANLYVQPQYTNIDASVGWTLPEHNLTFTVWGRNLLNAKTALGSFINQNTSGITPAPPLTYGIRVSASL